MMDLPHMKHSECVSMLYALQALREDIRWILVAGDISYRDFALGCDIPDEMVSNIEVLGPGVEYRVLYCFECTVRIRFDKRNWQRGFFAEYTQFMAQAAEPECFLCCEG